MQDPTPAPLGDFTRRWTALGPAERAAEAERILGPDCLDGDIGHVDRPGLDGGVCYQRLARAALVGDAVAIGWLVTTHRPTLIARGRALLCQDPTEWGTACLEVLHRTLCSVDIDNGPWLRKRVTRDLGKRLTRLDRRHVRHRRREEPSHLGRLHEIGPSAPGPGHEAHPELSAVLDLAMQHLDEAARDGLWALANQAPLRAVAEAHGLSYPALRQRVSRARHRVQPELAAFRRAV